MEILLGGLAGMITGAIGALIAELVGITAKRARNARLVRHGEPAVKDVIYNPPWLLCAILGLIAGLSWTWRLEGTWVIGAIAGAGAPAALILAWLIKLLAQLRR